MSQSNFLLDLPAGLEITQAHNVDLISAFGLSAERGFEIDSACGSGRGRICPHPENAPRECRLSGVQVRDDDAATVTLILHNGFF